MIEINNTTKSKINKKLIEKVAGKFLSSCRWQKKDLSLAFIGDAKMRQLNLQYRKKDKTTDVLSFSLLEGKKLNSGPAVKKVLGDVVISVPQAKRQARVAGKTFKSETAMLLVHGILHLLGYDHRSKHDEKHMFGLQERILRKFVTAQARQNNGQHEGTKAPRKTK